MTVYSKRYDAHQHGIKACGKLVVVVFLSVIVCVCVCVFCISQLKLYELH